MIKLMYITNSPEVAQIAQKAGVDRIFVDMEYIGKDKRQGGLDTVQNHHTIADIERLRPIIKAGTLLVRVNPIHDCSEVEINSAIAAGADILMLPYFKMVDEVQDFIAFTGGRAKTCLLLETDSAVNVLDEILTIPGIDEIHIGLNDLYLCYGMKFLFELAANDCVRDLVERVRAAGIPCGFGGVAAMEGGLLPGKLVLSEHVRVGSSAVILSRAFCNTDKVKDPKRIQEIFNSGVTELRKTERELEHCDKAKLESNHNELVRCVQRITEGK